MMAREPVPFVSERTQELRGKVLPLGSVTPSLDLSQLVRGWLTRGGFSVAYGPSNCGKTFLLADLGMHVATGQDWLGNKVQQGAVVYVAAEGGGGIRNRIAAMLKTRPEVDEAVPFYLLPTAINLMSEGDTVSLSELLPDTEVSLIVIDTMARALGHGDENAAKDVGIFVQNVDALRERTGAHVCVVHHSGKDADRGARGSSALRAAVDTEIAVSADHQVTAPKQRDLPQPAPLYFCLQTVELGHDLDGEPVTSAVVIQADEPTPNANKSKPLGGKAEVALEALRDAIREDGEVKNGPDWPGNRKVVARTKWFVRCDVHGLTSGTSESAARTAFARAKGRLIEFNKVRMLNDYAWLVDED